MNLANAQASMRLATIETGAKAARRSTRTYPKNTVINSIVPPIVTAGSREPWQLKSGDSVDGVSRGYEGGMILGVGTNFAR
jgi:hypothetical protein